MNERNIIEVETVFEIKDFWRYYFSQYFSFIHILFNVLGYTIFGWCIAFLFLRGNIEFLHLLDVVIGAVFFSFFVSFISAYLAIRNVKNFEGQKCKYTLQMRK
jgi:hypothetical protein